MLSMDQIHLIKKLAASGRSTREIAKITGFNRETVMKYIKKEASIPEPFHKERAKKIDSCQPYVLNLLQSDSAVANPKLRLTAKRIHELIKTGSLAADLPPLNVSIRTVERMVKDIRSSLRQAQSRQHLKLLHQPGKAQLDFGEITMLSENGESRHYILVMSFPHSNFRLAYALPAQNFECLAHGLAEMFKRIGRVPVIIRCDNMSTAVTKVIRRKNLGNGLCNHDAKDHPRQLTENFLTLMTAYGFDAEFCNPASGNEKGSVENAVGWVRRNFFCPLRSFNGNYDALNAELAEFCFNEARKPHYLHKPKSIDALFKEDLAAMNPPPDAPREVTHSWGRATVTEDCRIKVDTNSYQVGLPPGTKTFVKKFWNKLAIFTEGGQLVSEYNRQYGTRRDSINWGVELEMLSERPSAFNSSYLQSVCPQKVSAYLKQLTAPGRGVLLRALRQRFVKSRNIVSELSLLELALDVYGSRSAEEVAAAYRGAEDKLTDSIKPMKSVSHALGNMDLPPHSFSDVCKELEGGAHV